MQRTLRAFQAGDMATLTEVLDENVAWRVPGRNPMAADYHGRDTFKVESLDMFANDRGGVFVGRITASREGRALDVRLMLHVTIRDGRIVEGCDHFHQEHLWDAFWA